MLYAKQHRYYVIITTNNNANNIKLFIIFQILQSNIIININEIIHIITQISIYTITRLTSSPDITDSSIQYGKREID